MGQAQRSWDRNVLPKGLGHYGYSEGRDNAGTERGTMMPLPKLSCLKHTLSICQEFRRNVHCILMSSQHGLLLFSPIGLPVRTQTLCGWKVYLTSLGIAKRV